MDPIPSWQNRTPDHNATNSGDHVDGRTRSERPLYGTRLQNDGDLPIVFQGGDTNVFNVCAAGRAEGSRQFMPRHQFVTHDVLIQYAIMNKSTGSPFDPDLQFLAPESHN